MWSIWHRAFLPQRDFWKQEEGGKKEREVSIIKESGVHTHTHTDRSIHTRACSHILAINKCYTLPYRAASPRSQWLQDWYIVLPLSSRSCPSIPVWAIDTSPPGMSLLCSMLQTKDIREVRFLLWHHHFFFPFFSNVCSFEVRPQPSHHFSLRILFFQ